MNTLSLPRSMPEWMRYVFAILLVVLAAALQVWPLQTLDSSIEWLTFYTAVMAAAIYGGLYAGLLATVCSAIAAMLYWSFFADDPFGVADGLRPGMIVFLLNGLLISAVAEAMRRTQARLLKVDVQTKVVGRSTISSDTPPLNIMPSRGVEAIGGKACCPGKDENQSYALTRSAVAGCKHAEKVLSQQNQFSEDIINSLPGIFYMLDAQAKFFRVNQHFLSVTGYSRNELDHMTALDLFEGDGKSHIQQRMQEVFEKGISDAEADLVTKSGEKTPFYFTGRRTTIDNQTLLVGIGTDITEKKLASEQIEKLAHFDQLTGLPNRTLLQDHFKCTLCLAQRSSETFAVMFVDLDHFKDINDALGHSVGDLVLMEIAKRLTAALSETHILSRQGGDEFIVILPGTDAGTAATVASRLIDAVSQPCHIEQHELCVTPSIGIAMYPDDGATLETLSKNADLAMYRAKHSGRNDFCFFTPEMQIQTARHLKLANALRHALERNELHLNYQPQLSIQDGHIVGIEALLRWRHPEMGMISPAEFIPVAEESGLIIPIGEWVLRTATGQLKDWMEDGLPPMVMSVNLSPVQFRKSDLPELVARILDEVNLPHQYLELELTEAATMHDPRAAIAMMNRLHELGVRISIDDFGTGYSSLSYLKQFKIYKIKIDQSFVRDITVDPDDRAIVAAIISLASNLGLQTIAEGVETAEQLTSLRLQGCNEVQGYFYSKPLTVDQFRAYSRKNLVRDHAHSSPTPDGQMFPVASRASTLALHTPNM